MEMIATGLPPSGRAKSTNPAGFFGKTGQFALDAPHMGDMVRPVIYKACAGSPVRLALLVEVISHRGVSFREL
jgi:hypothetical protein